MTKVLSLSLLVLVFSIAAVAQNAGTISGTVHLGNENTVLHGASVQILELKQKTVTDEVGHYEFKNIAPGKYTVIAHQEGFADQKKNVDVPAGATAATADFNLQISGLKEEVTVSGSGTAESTFESVASVNTLDSTQLVTRAAVGLGDVLDNEPGVSKQTGGAAASRPVIRGFSGDRVKIASDGVSVGSLGSQSGDHSEPVDAMAVERIEVVKGPATLLYGSNAIGGVVNAISGHEEGAHPGFRGYFSGVGGTTNAQAGASGGAEYGRKNWMFWTNASAQRTGDYKAGGNFGTVRNTFARNQDGQIGFGYFAKKAYATANYSYYHSEYGIPLDFREPNPEKRSIRVFRGDLKLNFGYNDPNLFITSIKGTVDFSNYRHQEMSGGEVGTTFRNPVNSVRTMFEQKKEGNLTGRFGFETYHRKFSTVGDEVLINGPVTQKNFSFFGLEEVKFERATLQFGGRIENNSYNPVNPSYLDRSFTGFSGAIGAKFDLWTGGLFVANFQHGYRAPALEELYNNGPHDGSLLFEVGNQRMKPEINNGIDLSLRHKSGRFTGEANFYYYAFKNFVFLAPRGAFDPKSGLEFADYLQADSRFVGTELVGDFTINKWLNAQTGVDYVNAELKTGQPLPRIPPLRSHLGLDFHKGDFSVKPEIVAVGRQDRLFTNETPTAGYGTVNVVANYIIPTKHAAHVFSVNAFNLNNKLYFNHISFIKEIQPEIGRGVRFTYTVRFF